MHTTVGRTRARLRWRTGFVLTAVVLGTALIAPGAASAAESTGATFMDETFDAQTDPPNFGFPTGASIGGGVLNITEGMGNYTTSVRPFEPAVVNERTLDLSFDWKTAISSSQMKTGLELRDDEGRLVFGLAATAAELRYAVTGPDSDSTAAPDALNPNWTKTGFDRTLWYTVDLHMDFTTGTLQYSITSKEAAPKVKASGTGLITGQRLATFVACNYYGTGTQSIDNFRLTRPDYAAYGSLTDASVYAFGDSLVFGHRYSRSFVNLVAERERMRLTKYAVNGATVGPVSGDPTGKILTQVRSASSQAPDYVVFDGGTNDALTLHELAGYELGAVGDSTNPADFDTGTYAGSLEATIHAMQEKWPTARLVYVAAHKLGSRDWDTQLAIRDVTLQAARKWGVAVADVFADATLDTRVESQRVDYTFDNLVDGYPGRGGTGTHPNIAGMAEFYVPVLTARLVALANSGTLVARHSGKCAMPSGASTGSGVRIVQDPCTGSAVQQWQFETVGGGYFRIVSAHSGRCLDVRSNAKDNGAHVQQWDCHSGENQQWRVRDVGDGYVQLLARHSGKCLDVTKRSTADGTGLQQWDCHSGDNQQWRLGR